MSDTALITKRLILRSFTEMDVPALYKILGDEEVNRFLPWFSLKTVEDARLFYKERLEDRHSQECLCNYAICLKEDNDPIGYIKVGEQDSYDFGYGLCKGFWRKGIVTEAGGSY